jgi:hypothetical protein
MGIIPKPSIEIALIAAHRVVNEYISSSFLKTIMNEVVFDA